MEAPKTISLQFNKFLREKRNDDGEYPIKLSCLLHKQNSNDVEYIRKDIYDKLSNENARKYVTLRKIAMLID